MEKRLRDLKMDVMFPMESNIVVISMIAMTTQINYNFRRYIMMDHILTEDQSIIETFEF